MKKMKGLIFSIFVFLIGIPMASATCTAEESNKLNSLAVNVKANYEITNVQKTEFSSEFNPPDGMDIDELENYIWYEKVIKIHVMNLTEELYIKITNNESKEVQTFHYEDAVDGIISLEQKNFEKIINYTITIYSSDKTNCPDSKLYTTYLTTPMYNTYSEYAICEGIEDFYLCHEYLSTSVSFDNFFELANKYKEGKIDSNGEEIKEEKEDKKSFIEFIKNNKGIVITISIVIVITGGIITVIIVKKQRSKII